MKTVHLTIRGVTPLLVNRFHEEAQAEATSGIHQRQEYPGPEADAANRLYQNGDGPYIPSENIRKSFIEAATRTKIGRRNASTDMAAAIFIQPDAITLSGSWLTDSRPVVNPFTKGRILRHRPRFDTWSLSFDLEVETELIDLKTVRTIIDDAGNYVGLGDFRPARRGPYGRFRVDSWQEEKESR